MRITLVSLLALFVLTEARVLQRRPSHQRRQLVSGAVDSSLSAVELPSLSADPSSSGSSSASTSTRSHRARARSTRSASVSRSSTARSSASVASRAASSASSTGALAQLAGAAASVANNATTVPVLPVTETSALLVDPAATRSTATLTASAGSVTPVVVVASGSVNTAVVVVGGAAATSTGVDVVAIVPGQLSTHTELAFVTNSASAAALAQLNANSGASRLQAATAVLGAMIGGVAMVALA